MKELKEQRRGRISEYADTHTDARYIAGGRVWDVPCEVALPSATELSLIHI